MSLNSMDWQRRYRSTRDSNFLVKEFFRPALEKSTIYLRGAGFFSSSVFESVGESLGTFVENGGKMRLIMNVRMTPDDHDAVNLGLSNWDTIVDNEIGRIIKEEFSAPIGNGARILTRLLEMGRLEIRIARKPEGIYHEKIGVFFDEQDIDLDASFEKLSTYNHLAFFGSVNESRTGWERSHENIKAYWSWSEDQRAEDAKETLQDFVDNWNAETSGLNIHTFPEAAKQGLLDIASETEHLAKMGITVSQPDSRKVWIEKTKVAGRRDREAGSRALGKAIWSPTKSAQDADIYAEMREVNKGDLIIHLVNNTSKDTYISGVSVVRNESVIVTEGVAGTSWEGPAYLHELEDYIKLENPIYRPDILSDENRDVMDRVRESGKVFYTKNMQLRQGHYLTPCVPKLAELLNMICMRINGTPLPHLNKPITQKVQGAAKEESGSLYSFQKEAVDWFCDENKANGVGLFEMATGSGKTFTSMACMKRLFEEGRVDQAMVVVPNILLKQWEKEIRKSPEWLLGFGNGKTIEALYEFSSRKKKQHLRFKKSKKKSLLLVSFSTFMPLLKMMRNWDSEFLERTLVVLDEVHNVGSDRFRKLEIEEFADKYGVEEEEQLALENDEGIFSNFGYRLGLSATPWSWHDEENGRNSFLVRSLTRYEDDIQELLSHEREVWQKDLRDRGLVFSYGLKEAIEAGTLAEFDYDWLDYEPTEDEKEEYRKRVRSGFGKDEKGKRNPLGAIRAAAVFKGSENKIPIFEKWLDDNPKLDRSLIFVEDGKFGEVLMELLSKKGYTDFRRFFMGDDDSYLQSFARGDDDFLIACHRISEGVDISTVRQIILFSSSTSPLETIQRIGRALRREGNEKKRSTIVDFIYDNPSSDTNPDVMRRDWLVELAKSRNPEVN